MSNTTTIQISRSRYIEVDRATALLRLDQHYFYPGEPVEVRYSVTNPNGQGTEVDTILAVGISEGYGKDNYKVMSLGGLELVQDVVTELPDVSALIHGEIYLYQDPKDEVWYYVYKVNEDRQIEQVVGKEMTFVNISDRYRWFWKDGVMKREDDFFTNDMIQDTIDELFRIVFPPYIEAKSTNGYLFRSGESVQIQLEISIKNKVGENFTDEYIIKVDGNQVYTPTAVGGYKPWTSPYYSVSHDFQIYAESVRGGSITGITSVVQVRFGYDVYYGIVDPGWTPTEAAVISLDKDLKARENVRWENIDLDDQITVFASPKVYGKLEHIFDENGLCILNDYNIREMSIDGIPYYIYWKKEPIQIQGLIQEFVYSAEDTADDLSEDEILYRYEEIIEAWKKQNMPGGMAIVKEDGKLPASLIPDIASNASYIELIGFVDVVPEYGLEVGSKYFNTTTRKIFTATNSHSGVESEPLEGKIYVNLEDKCIYIWKGLEMVNVTGTIQSDAIISLSEIL